MAEAFTIASIIIRAGSFIKENWKVLLPIFIVILLSPFFIYMAVTSILLPHIDYEGLDLYAEVAEANEIELSVLLAYDTIRLLNNMAEAVPQESVFDFLIIEYHIFDIEEVTKMRSDVKYEENIEREFLVVEDGTGIKMAVEKIYTLKEEGSCTGFELIREMLNREEFLYTSNPKEMTIPKVTGHLKELGEKDEYFFDCYVLSGEEIINSFTESQIKWFNGLSKLIAKMFDDVDIISTDNYVVSIPEGMEADYFPAIWPAIGTITSYFGEIRSGGHIHKGIDISLNRGTNIHCTASGIVMFVGWQSGYGKTIMVHHGSGITTLYGHLDTLLVRAGQEIDKGYIIGKSGNSGRSAGPHLHYEIRVNGVAKNPMGYLN